MCARRRFLCSCVATLLTSGLLIAAGSTVPAEADVLVEQTWGVSGLADSEINISWWVRDLEHIGARQYAAGRFTDVVAPIGSTRDQPFLAAFDRSTGAWISEFTPVVLHGIEERRPRSRSGAVRSARDRPIVFDIEEADDLVFIASQSNLLTVVDRQTLSKVRTYGPDVANEDDPNWFKSSDFQALVRVYDSVIAGRHTRFNGQPGPFGNRHRDSAAGDLIPTNSLSRFNMNGDQDRSYLMCQQYLVCSTAIPRLPPSATR